MASLSALPNGGNPLPTGFSPPDYPAYLYCQLNFLRNAIRINLLDEAQQCLHALEALPLDSLSDKAYRTDLFMTIARLYIQKYDFLRANEYLYRTLRLLDPNQSQDFKKLGDAHSNLAHNLSIMRLKASAQAEIQQAEFFLEKRLILQMIPNLSGCT
ncbi:MAG: hypothetical protein HC880_16600 [Bacteroidia bacterium]|nr:hypothetical protein [Bacteroidia bacterium]